MSRSERRAAEQEPAYQITARHVVVLSRQTLEDVVGSWFLNQPERWERAGIRIDARTQVTLRFYVDGSADGAPDGVQGAEITITRSVW